MIKDILVPVDGSEHAEKAVALGADLATKYDGRLVLVHVLLSGPVPESIRNLSDLPGAPEPPMAVGAGYVESSLPRDVLTDIADKILGRAKETAQQHGVQSVETAWVSGNAADRILEQASKHKVDTIVMGSRGLSDLKGLLVGSVSHKIGHVFEGTVITVK